MLSGIGDAAELRQVGITPVVDLPEVGKNLQDHVSFLHVQMLKAINTDENLAIASRPYPMDREQQ